mmetsp:Transcript_2994/g.4922  ORF Transcript_2994/g.4922 Transcript_2994/m.4922 type:complete len:235 (-) Transcript_2994:943-1647(-)
MRIAKADVEAAEFVTSISSVDKSLGVKSYAREEETSGFSRANSSAPASSSSVSAFFLILLSTASTAITCDLSISLAGFTPSNVKASRAAICFPKSATALERAVLEDISTREKAIDEASFDCSANAFSVSLTFSPCAIFIPASRTLLFILKVRTGLPSSPTSPSSMAQPSPPSRSYQWFSSIVSEAPLLNTASTTKSKSIGCFLCLLKATGGRLGGRLSRFSKTSSQASTILVGN